MTNLDVGRIRGDFPILVDNPDLIYFDSAATAQKPKVVMEAVEEFYRTENANPLRGTYDLAMKATEKLATARRRVAEFIGAEPDEIIFTKNTTESLNKAAQMLLSEASSDDEVIVGLNEHHSNLLPWLKMVAMRRCQIFNLNPDETTGGYAVNLLEKALTPNSRVVAVSMMSNVTGHINDVATVVELAHKWRAAVVVDAAQAVVHTPIDVKKLNCEMLAFSGHKLGAPMGIGVLYIRKDLQKTLLPIDFGGEMVDGVKVVDRRLRMMMAKGPRKYEAGTVNVGGAVGLAAAIDYLRDEHDFLEMSAYVKDLTGYAKERVSEVDGVKVVGAENGILSFVVEGVHSHDVAEILNSENICVRAGWLCAQPLLEHLGVGPVVRASFSFYNTKTEIEKMVAVLSNVRNMMGVK